MSHSPSKEMRYLTFAAARKFVRKLRLPSAAAFREWATGKCPGLPPKPEAIPSNPHHVYRDDFLGYSDFLRSGNIAPYNRQWAPFADAKRFVHSLGLGNGKQYARYCQGLYPQLARRPPWLPSNPNLAYKKIGWRGMRDWLGTGAPVSPRGTMMRPYAEAREFAQSLRLVSYVEWREYVNGERRDLPMKPADIPALPFATYKGDGWTTWRDFLGSKWRAWHSTEWRQFGEARDWARTLGLRNQKEWRVWYKANGPRDIPYGPDRVYEDWLSWSDWLGVDQSRSTRRRLAPSVEAKSD